MRQRAANLAVVAAPQALLPESQHKSGTEECLALPRDLYFCRAVMRKEASRPEALLGKRVGMRQRAANLAVVAAPQALLPESQHKSGTEECLALPRDLYT